MKQIVILKLLLKVTDILALKRFSLTLISEGSFGAIARLSISLII